VGSFSEKPRRGSGEGKNGLPDRLDVDHVGRYTATALRCSGGKHPERIGVVTFGAPGRWFVVDGPSRIDPETRTSSRTYIRSTSMNLFATAATPVSIDTAVASPPTRSRKVFRPPSVESNSIAPPRHGNPAAGAPNTAARVCSLNPILDHARVVELRGAIRAASQVAAIRGGVPGWSLFSAGGVLAITEPDVSASAELSHLGERCRLCRWCCLR